jgi:hypothetical protein
MFVSRGGDSRTGHCNFRGYEGIEKNAANLFDLIKENHPNKVVVDLCQNGGDYNLGKKLVIDPFTVSPTSARKTLFVLIGPFAFSTGMVNVAQFGSETHALLVGEPSGEKPNSFQEAREMHLPDSHLIARYSTERRSFADTSENVIRPDRLVERDWEFYQAGRDPVLEWVSNYKISHTAWYKALSRQLAHGAFQLCLSQRQFNICFEQRSLGRAHL